MPVRYFTWLLLTLLAAPAAAQQAPAAPGARTYVVFLHGSPVGREEVTVTTDLGGTTITGRGRLLPPLDVVTRLAEVRYLPDWTLQSFTYDLTARGMEVMLRATFKGGSGTWDGTESGNAVSITRPIAPDTFVLPNMFFGGYEAVARRVASAGVGATFHAMSAPGVDVPMTVTNIVTDRIQMGTSVMNVRRYELRFANQGNNLTANLTLDASNELLRLYIPSQDVDVVREDLASAGSRTQLHTNPGDEALLIPAAGFNLGATLTRPGTGAARLPAVVLVGGAESTDRDGYSAGIPLFGQLAGALADAGFLVVRYDKRGYGQSGGRSESATLSDFADDARGIVRWLANRKDVDPRRIALAGHADGAWVALLAASRDKRIAAVVSIAGPSTTGDELILEQQRRALEQMNAPPTEREEKIALQKRIHAAVLSGSGWNGIPAEMRRQADTPWFQSLLAFDPAKAIRNLRQPILLVHGDLDRQVPVSHIDRLANLARTASKSKSVEVVTVRGVNHLLVPATTGEASEYATLRDQHVSGDVTMAVSSWLTKTFAGIR